MFIRFAYKHCSWRSSLRSSAEGVRFTNNSARYFVLAERGAADCKSKPLSFSQRFTNKERCDEAKQLVAVHGRRRRPRERRVKDMPVACF